MCTGDNPETAKAIAHQAGIIKTQEQAQQHQTSNVCLTGHQFREKVGRVVKMPRNNVKSIPLDKDMLNDTDDIVEKLENMDEFVKVIQELKVLARSSPEDKYILVTGLQQMNQVVAVTGDGTNDAPALKKSDVGFAMKSGTMLA